jgi:hypothetical protein
MAAACLSVGCAFTNVDVHPPESMGPRAAPGPGRAREVILVAPFEDAREERDRCGMQMNGWRMDTADVVCNETPGRWLADALAVTLTHDGYRVLSSTAVAGPSTIVVHGSVRKLFLEPHDGVFTRTVEGDFSVHLVVTTGSGLRAERTFFVKGTEEHIGSFESVFQAAADDATRRIANAMSGALSDLLTRYPELGAPEATRPVALNTPGAP